MSVGEEVVRDPARDVGPGDDVRVDGTPLAVEEREVWAVNKPAGVVSTAKEPGSRPAVVELVSSEARLYPVGRLDADSTGLLLLTNDGELANLLTHPRYEVPKAYRVQLARAPRKDELSLIIWCGCSGPTGNAIQSPARTLTRASPMRTVPVPEIT